jgi:hypothetical protein
MKNPHPRDVPVVRDLSPNLMVEIGRVIFSHAYVEWRLNLIVYDFLHVTKVLGRLVGRDIRPMDQFDLICDLISLKDVRTGVDLIRLRKSLLSATTQRDLLAHGTWVRHPQTKAFLLHLARARDRVVLDADLNLRTGSRKNGLKHEWYFAYDLTLRLGHIFKGKEARTVPDLTMARLCPSVAGLAHWGKNF